MIQRISLILLSLMLVFAATAEATNGHCAKSQMTVMPAMSEHCAQMMGDMATGMDMPEAPAHAPDQSPDQSDASICCCAISVTPVLYVQPMPGAPSIIRAAWAAPTAITGPPSATYVDLPPPRI